MSQTGKMNGNDQPDLRPKVRFPEFEADGAWHTKAIGEVSEPIKERVGEHKITPVSITAGVGFVPQADKFGRDISGEQYKNYTYLRRGDFAYNKGNSKSFPQGYVCQLHEFDEVAASSAFICFKLKDGYEPTYLKGLFDRNTHGRQLAAHITSGARSNGLLNLNASQFYGVQLPFPPNFEEQERIAECLASINALIEAEAEKLDALKDHKKGLMRQLFPAEGESLPPLRFRRFVDQEDWRVTPLGGECNLYQPQTLSKSQLSEDGEFLVYGANGVIGRHVEYNHAESEVIVTCRGATCGEVHQTKPMSWITGNAMVVRPKSPSLHKDFLAHLLRADGLQSVITGSAQPQITRAGFAPLPVAIPPSEEEQEAVAITISSVDTLISSQNGRVEALKNHKLGLLQKLFPVLGEVDG